MGAQHQYQIEWVHPKGQIKAQKNLASQEKIKGKMVQNSAHRKKEKGSLFFLWMECLSLLGKVIRMFNLMVRERVQQHQVGRLPLAMNSNIGYTTFQGAKLINCHFYFPYSRKSHANCLTYQF